MLTVDTLVCVEPGRLRARAAVRTGSQRRPGPGPPAPGGDLRHRLPHLRGVSSLPAVSAGDGARARRRGRRGRGRLRPDAGRGLRGQPLSLLRPVQRLSRWQAQLLRADLRARRPPGRRHDRAADPARGQPLARAGPDPGSMRRRRVPRHRRARGSPRGGDRARPRARRRRRPDRPRRRPLRTALRGRGRRCSTATPRGRKSSPRSPP